MSLKSSSTISLVVSLLLLPCFLATTEDDEKQDEFFALMKTSLSGNALSDWDTAKIPGCNLTGVGCNDQGHVTSLDISWWSLSGHFPVNVCEYLPALRILRLGKNQLVGEFPRGVTNCSLLEELDLSFLYLHGTLPDFSGLQRLRVLNLATNHFTGKFPLSVMNLTSLEILNFNEIGNLSDWNLPEDISGLVNLRSLVLGTCFVHGPIPKSIGNMTLLVDLELSGNFLTGPIPPELGRLKNLKMLELYYNQLTGEIPHELGNLSELLEFDLSVNRLVGVIPESICRLPKLKVLQLYNNSLRGEIPAVLTESKTLTMLSLYSNYLTGQVPRSLGASSAMVVFDVSENNLTGPLPTEVCRQGVLGYFLVLENKFSGELPESYVRCRSLLRFRVNYNRLEGSIPEGLLSLPHVSIIDLSFNNLTGVIGESISEARNLSELFIQSNKISGVLPKGISRARNLVKVDLSNNLISGPIPSEIGNLKRLNLLLLQGNAFSSSIPDSLSLLTSLNVLDLSNNRLTGKIPESLAVLLPSSINFSNNMLSGPIPLKLVKDGLVESFAGNPSLCLASASDIKSSRRGNLTVCSKRYNYYNQKKLNSIWAIALSLVIILVGVVLLLKRRFRKNPTADEPEEPKTATGTMFSSFFSYDVKSFHRVNFDQREITNAMTEKNIVGHGGSGTVYRIEVKSKEVVAVKRLWSQNSEKEEQVGGAMNKELKTEVETLGSIRHKNIVKLYCYFSSPDCNLLVYEYMPNGNLWDALHKGRVSLDWPTRHQIALGVAQGLAYLHHDLLRPIIHRDIKSTNILLDVNYQPKVADFGIAKVLQARGGKDSTTTVIAGTYGYLAPEYAFSSKATTKCDVYSFGVVLMELITGKKPVEAEFGENKNIIYWVSNKVDTREGAMEVLDKSASASYKDEMIQALRIAVRCTYKNPALRPTMKEAVHLLLAAAPRGVPADAKIACKDRNQIDHL